MAYSVLTESRDLPGLELRDRAGRDPEPARELAQAQLTLLPMPPQARADVVLDRALGRATLATLGRCSGRHGPFYGRVFTFALQLPPSRHLERRAPS